MPLTTAPPSVDITEYLPELADWRRTAIRLHPRAGRSTTDSPHIGGEILWPSGDGWPHCRGPHIDQNLTPRDVSEPTPYIVVAQLTHSDVPVIRFAGDTDLLQILWCPHDHEVTHRTGYVYLGPLTTLKWHDSTAPGLIATRAQPDSDAFRQYLPQTCVLHPEQVLEYPDHEELPADLQDRLDQLDDEHDLEYQYGLSIANGWKAGGWPSWRTSGNRRLTCEVCSSAMQLLLKISSVEWDGGSTRWWPLEERNLDLDQESAAQYPTGVEIGRDNDLQIFTCATDPTHPPVLDIQ